MSRLILFLMLLTLPLYSQAGNNLIDLQDISLDYARFIADNRHPVLYPIAPKERVDLNVNLDLFRYVFLRNTIHSLTDDSQYRLVGWKYRMGIKLGIAEVYGEHFSQHLLDSAPKNGFPVENSIGIKIYLYKRD